MEEGEEPWMVARRGIKLLLNDRNEEAERLFTESEPHIQITAGVCYFTFMNALMCFDDKKVNEAVAKIKSIEEQCASQIGWIKSFKSKIFTGYEETKSLEQALEEKIVLADALVCQAFLTFLQNDFTSYMKGGWTLRRAWKLYQHTHQQLTAIHKQIFGNCTVSGWSSSTPSEESEGRNFPANAESPDGENFENLRRNFYSHPNKTYSGLSTMQGAEADCESQSSPVRPDNLNLRSGAANGHAIMPGNQMRKSVSLFSSLNSFSFAILESATSLMGFNKEPYKEWDRMEPETVLRLMSAVSFGYGVFRLCISLAPPSILRWANMLGFEGDHVAAVKSLHYSRKGSDMRAPLASLALLWYHTIVTPFFNLDGGLSGCGIKEAIAILEEEAEYADSALFLFFRGRVERLKSNLGGAIEAYQLSVSKATLPEVKLLGLHEVGWCHLLTFDYSQAHKCFLQLKQQSKWSKSFYAYLTAICTGAIGNYRLIPHGRAEIKYFLDKSPNKGAQIEKYIRRRMEKLPDTKEYDEEWAKDVLHWKLYCFEMLYLWNTLSSCRSVDLENIVNACAPANGETTLKHEPMKGVGWLVRGAASSVLAGRQRRDAAEEDALGPVNYFTVAVEAFRMCLEVRSKCSDDAHVSAFAQYELALLLLRNENTRPEGKILLIRMQNQYFDYDFEQRLVLRVSATLKSIDRYESEIASK